MQHLSHVMQYLKGAPRAVLNVGLSVDARQACPPVGSGRSLVLAVFSDSDFSAAPDGLSYSGCCVQVFRGDVFVASLQWCSRRQKCISLSSTEAETVAAIDALRGADPILSFLEDVGWSVELRLYARQ